jgi:putative transposase
VAKRIDVYEAAKQRHPQCWSGATRNWNPVRVVHLDPEHHVIDKNNPGDRNHQLK